MHGTKMDVKQIAFFIFMIILVATSIAATVMGVPMGRRRMRYSDFQAVNNSIGCDVPEGSTCYIRNRDIGLPARGIPYPEFEQDFLGAIPAYRLAVQDARNDRTNTFLETQELNKMRLK